MDNQALLKILTPDKIGDDAFNRINDFPISPINSCPTCDGKKYYHLDGKSYECNCEVQRLLQRHYFAANIGREYHDICLKDFIGPNREIVVPVVQEYIDKFSSNFHYGLGITFSGPLGTGKTFAMTCVLKELVKQGRKVYFTTFQELINTWGASYKDDAAKETLERKLKSVDVLGLDELKSDKRNEIGFLASGLDYIVRHRTSNLLPTLLTTNMTPSQEENEFGKAFSLLSARNQRVFLNGNDNRGTEIRERVYHLASEGDRRPIC